MSWDEIISPSHPDPIFALPSKILPDIEFGAENSHGDEPTLSGKGGLSLLTPCGIS